MPEASSSITIQRPVDVVFDFVADGEKCPLWRPSVLDIKRVSGDGVGTIYTQGAIGPIGLRIAADYEITVFESNLRIEFQVIAGPVRPRGRYDFEAVDGGTRITFSLDVTLTGLTRLLMSSSVQRTMNAEVQTLGNLKRVLETWA